MSKYYSAVSSSSITDVHSGGGSAIGPVVDADMELDIESDDDHPDPFDACIDDVGEGFEFDEHGET